MSTPTLPPGFVIGDGSSAKRVAQRGWNRFGWLTALTVFSILAIAFLALTKAPTSSTPLSIHSAKPEGAQAVAEILRAQGVTVKETGSLSGAASILGEDGTLVIGSYLVLDRAQQRSIDQWHGDVVWLAPQPTDLAAIDGRLSYTWAGDRATVKPACSLDAARRAQSIVVEGQRISVGEGGTPPTSCYVDGFGTAVFVQFERQGAGTVTVIGAPSFMTNADLALKGNAALALNLLGTHDHVAWYMGSPYDTSTLSGSSGQVSLRAPAWTNPALLAVVLVFFGAAAWRGRRMGALVTEPLPVVVPGSEATKGRARLYRRGRAVGHASAALRAGVARRLASRLGLGPHASPTELVAALTAATGHESARLTDLLYGPPPCDEAAMLDLVRRLDALESEVDPT